MLHRLRWTDNHDYLRLSSFASVKFDHPSFQSAWLEDVCFTGADLTGATFTGAKASGANFANAKLCKAQIDDATLTGANIAGADFFEAVIQSGDWGQLRGAPQAKNLEESRLINPQPKYFEHCEQTRLEQWCSWERLRTFGRLPLFGASWSGFAFVATYVYLIAWHNQQVKKIDGWHGPGGEWMSRHLHELPLPSMTCLLFISTVLLAGASTLYSIFCPPRIREFSKEKWCDELGRPLLHYWPLAWRNPRLRLACGALYVSGAMCAAVVIVVKIFTTGKYIWENTQLW